MVMNGSECTKNRATYDSDHNNDADLGESLLNSLDFVVFKL